MKDHIFAEVIILDHYYLIFGTTARQDGDPEARC